MFHYLRNRFLAYNTFLFLRRSHTSIAPCSFIVSLLRTVGRPLAKFFYRLTSLASNAGPIAMFSDNTAFTLTCRVVCKPHLVRYIATSRQHFLTMTAYFLLHLPLNALRTFMFGIGFVPLLLAKATSRQHFLTMTTSFLLHLPLNALHTFTFGIGFVPLLLAKP